MKNFSKIDKQNILINALFLQPTTFCRLNCNGCYVKEWSKKEVINAIPQHMSHTVWGNIVRTFMGLEDIYLPSRTGVIKDLQPYTYGANQITLALDDHSYVNAQKDYMLNIFNRVLEEVANAKYQGIETEFHITTHTTQSINNYLTHDSKIERKNSTTNCLKYIDMVSISDFRIGDRDILGVIKKNKTKINWNFMPHPSFTEEHIAEALEIVDSVYVILHKPDLGIHIPRKTIKHYFDMIELLKNKFPKHLYKINIDGCVTDAKKYAEKGFGCSSNISRFQIWPNGSVSGCPYSHRPITPSAFGIHEEDSYAEIEDVILSRVLDNIRKASKIYQFKNCKIPEDIYPNFSYTVPKRFKSLDIF
jgi:hypothetical protein